MYICGVTRNGLQTYFFTRKRKCYSLIVRNLVNFKKNSREWALLFLRRISVSQGCAYLD